MHCNKCGEEVFTTPSQYTKFCKDCGKIIIKLDTLSTPKETTPPPNSPFTDKTSTVNYPQNNPPPAFPYNEPVFPPARKNEDITKYILVGILIFIIAGIGIVLYQNKGNTAEVIEETPADTAAEAVTEEVTEAAAVEDVNTYPENVSNNFTDDFYTNKITQYYNIEKNRNFDDLYNNYLYSVTRYYDIKPNYDELKKRFEYLWGITSDVSNHLKSFSVYRYDNHTEVNVMLDYSYFALKSQEYRNLTDINVVFNFDKDGNMIGIFENK